MRRSLWIHLTLAGLVAGASLGGRALAQQATGASLVRSKPYTDEELKEISLLPELLRLYRWGTQVYLAITDHIVERTYLNEKAKVKKAYEGQIETSRRHTEARRLEAIKDFEAWIKRYPNDRRWTPDILFRLAELYYEKATVDFQYAQVQYQDAVRRVREESRKLGKELPEPPEPQIDYTIPISYYRRIIKEFPDYRNRDVVFYLLGYCLREMSKQAEEEATDEPESPDKPSKSRVFAAKARQAFLGLVCANRYKPTDPPSEPTVPAELESAIAADEEEMAGRENLDLARFDPYKGCKPAISLSKFTGMELKKRQALLSQAWFILGEQHFDADPIVTLNDQEKEQLKAEFFKHRSKEQYVNDYQRMLAEKKEKKVKIHNYYAISAYTRVIQNFKGAEEYPDALYKRAWTYFRVNMYSQALDEFDRLLLESTDEALRDNAVRYVALCAYYQRLTEDKFGYLKQHYQKKGWLHDSGGPNGKYRHVKRAFHELAKIFYEDAAPPADMPGAENYRSPDLLAALKVYRWILTRAGFGPDKPGETDLDWKYYKGRAEVQKAIIDIIYLLSVNNEVQKDWPRKLFQQERRKAFNRFSTFDSSPYKQFATKYEKMYGEDPGVRKALASLRQTSLLDVANEYYLLGRKAWEGKQAKINELIKEIVALNAQISALKASGDQEGLSKAQVEVETKKKELADITKTFADMFDQAVKSYDVIINHPQFKDTMDAYKALFFKADCLFYSNRYLEAADAYKAAADSKISNRYRLQALRGRVDAYQLHNQLNVIPPAPPSPDRDKNLVAKPIPASVLKWHEAMSELVAAEENKVDAVPFSFQIAFTYYQYAHADKAYELLWKFLQEHCDTREAFYASKALLAMALIKNNKEGNSLTSLKQLDVERQKLAKAKCGTNVTFPPKTPKEQMEKYGKEVKEFFSKMLGLAADIRMNRADALYQAARKAKGTARESKYLAAAKELEEIARRYPNSPKAAISLYYAAEGYEQTRRFRKAKAIYEEIVKNPKYREQIRRVKEEDCTGSGSHQRCRTKVSNKLDNVVNFLAQAAWKAMEFDAAMKYYGQLAKGKVPTDEPAIRVNAYYWYARLLRIYDKPRDSVSYFMKYYRDITKVIAALQKKLNKTTNPQDRKDLQAQLSEARRFRVEVFYEIGKIYEHLNDLGGMERYYGTYIRQVADRLGSRNTASSDYYKKNAGDRAAAMKMMEALHKLAQGNKARHRTRKASEYEQKIISYFDKFHMPKGENPAADYAAEIAFRQVESEFRRFMARKIKLRGIRLKARIRKGMKAKEMLAAMCELMGWGKNRRTGQLCAPGKALLMLRDVVNPYVAEVNKLTQKLYNDVGLKYLHPKWVLAVRARMGQMFVKAATDLDGLPVPSEVKSFWKVFWAFVQKYKASYRAFFEKLMSVYELDIDDEELDQDTILDAYKDKTYTTIRKNSQALRNEAIRNFVEGIKLARSLGMATKWTKIMRKGLSDIDPDRFPYVHDAKVAK